MSAAPCRYFEYSSAAAVDLPTQPAVAFPSTLHTGPSASTVTPLDLSAALGSTPYPATSPNLLASFLTVIPGCAPLATNPSATSQLFYVIRGSGSSASADGGLAVAWGEGDVFTVPGCTGALIHTATAPSSLYWVHDSPLLQYLGVAPAAPTFAPAVYKREELLAQVEEIRHQPGAEHRNRMGVLLAHEATEGETKTLTRVLWALLNTLPPRTAQPPHRHNSVALDLCVSAAAGKVCVTAEGRRARPMPFGPPPLLQLAHNITPPAPPHTFPRYTLMGPELGEDGWVKNPVRMDWLPGAVFTTPPGWWHSHHNDGDERAWVLPVQDAGLLTRQRVLDIRFSHALAP